jgi:hypothetical protein
MLLQAAKYIGAGVNPIIDAKMLDTASNILLKEPLDLGTATTILVVWCVVVFGAFALLFPGKDPDKEEKTKGNKKPESPWEEFQRKKQWRETFNANVKKANLNREPLSWKEEKCLKKPQWQRKP